MKNPIYTEKTYLEKLFSIFGDSPPLAGREQDFALLYEYFKEWIDSLYPSVLNVTEVYRGRERGITGFAPFYRHFKDSILHAEGSGDKSKIFLEDAPKLAGTDSYIAVCGKIRCMCKFYSEVMENHAMYMSQEIIAIIGGDIILSLHENLLTWIENLNLLDDKWHCVSFKELKYIAEESKSEEQLIDSMLVMFCEKSLREYENLHETTELIDSFKRFYDYVTGHAMIKKELVNFINTRRLPPSETIEHIRNSIAFMGGENCSK